MEGETALGAAGRTRRPRAPARPRAAVGIRRRWGCSLPEAVQRVVEATGVGWVEGAVVVQVAVTGTVRLGVEARRSRTRVACWEGCLRDSSTGLLTARQRRI